MPTVNTVTGPIDAARLGFVLMHEHVRMGDHDVRANYPHLFDRNAELAEAADRLRQVKARGIGAVVDLTTVDLGRDAPFVRDASAQSGVPVILGTGIWWQPNAYFVLRPLEVMEEVFVRDIQVGIAETDIKAGIIKLATDEAGVTEGIEKALRAGARAHRRTGVPISTHTHAASEMGTKQQDIFQQEGVDLSRVVIGHSGDSTDLAYLKRIMERGSYIGMDRFGLDLMLDTKSRVATVAALCQAGYAERMVLSHDASCCWMTLPRDHEILHANPDYHLNFLSDTVLPLLKQAGVSDDQIQQMGVHNPRAIFERQGAY